MYQAALILHLLGTVIWVGGMFFAHLALRPALEESLEPAQRLPLLYRTLIRFFRWVWASILLILLSGYWIFFGVFDAQTMGYIHTMQAIGLVMIGLFAFIYFIPFTRMERALEEGRISDASKQMALIRGIILINLILGLIEVALGAAKPF